MATGKEAVLAKLRQQRAAESLVDVDAIRREWQAATEDLIRRLRGWFEDVPQEGLFRIEDEEIERSEERLGTYRVPALKLTTPSGDILRIAPRARFVLGAYGRVDFDCPPKRGFLVRPDLSRWQFARLEPGSRGWTSEDLSEDSLWRTIDELLS